ncbi:MAG: Asp-tRNA(Asn)/Glu-tRNA(Gln) amidotransferase subunit GatB [Firmicutes bacterium]|nr:Asp-tRNA(Asn)/Glu-tRNA(Gln) amidotransferase subunit GatB [Bacillota bacterium]
MKYDVVIGLEIHAELNTNTKLFCGCANDTNSPANTNVCPMCLAMPGAIPIVNKAAIEKIIMAGHAFDCVINEKVFFERKHYFYPDLPAGYQISQLAMPQCIGGHANLKNGKRIRLNRIHLEEDAGKSMHDEVNQETLIDLNRAGVPLIEMVTEPDISSSQDAMEFLEEVRSRLTFAGVAFCKMEEGGMRCDVNISLKPSGSKKLGNRIEMKNLNSFKMVGRAIEYEIKRQSSVLDDGGVVSVETRKWNDGRGVSLPMRRKSGEADYRYFADPDQPVISIPTKEIERLKKALPRLAHEWRNELSKMGLTDYDADILTRDKVFLQFYMENLNLLNEPKKVANWLITDVLARCENFRVLISPKQFVDVIKLVDLKKISKKNSLDLIDAIWGTDKDAEKCANELKILGGIGASDIEKIVNDLVKQNQKAVADYTTTPDKVVNFFMGQVMKITQGKADSVLTKEIVIKKASSTRSDERL